MLEKPCVGFTGHIFIPIIMKLGQKVCLDKIGHVRSKTRLNVRKLLCMLYKPHFQSNNYDQHVCLDEISNKYENWS